MDIRDIDISKVITDVLAWLKGSPYLKKTDFPEHTPERLLIGCVDARMPIAGLRFPRGSTLIKRKIAALVPEAEDDVNAETGGVLEFAIKAKNVKEIVVMGHTDCGGIGACLDESCNLAALKKYLTPLAAVGQEVAKSGGDKHLQARVMEIAAVCMSLKNLSTYPCVSEAMKAGKLQVVGRVLDVRDNTVYGVEETDKGFALKKLYKAMAPNEQNRS